MREKIILRISYQGRMTFNHTTNERQTMDNVQDKKGVDQITAHNLAGFTGTQQYFKHWTRMLVYTDGVQFIGENGAYWIIDLIASYQTADLIHRYPFQAWKIRRTKEGGFIATGTDGNDKEIVKQEGEYTDLKCDLDFFLQADPTHRAVLMVTSEY